MASSNNIADQIANAVQNAVNSKDFSNLQSSIERSIDVAAQSIGKGIAQASDGFRRGQEQYAAIQQRKRQEEQMNALYAKPSSERGAGVALVATGCALAVPLLACGGLLLLVNWGAAATSLVVGAACAVMAAVGGRKLQLAKRFERYRDVIGLRDRCSIEELAAACADTTDNVRKNVKKMLAKGLFRQAALDNSETMLLMTPGAYQQYESQRAEALRQQHQRDLAESARAAEPKAEPTAQQRQILERGEGFIAQIRESNQVIPGEDVSRTLDQIEHIVRAILDCAAENPEVIGDLDRLMDYYLPTTVKLLDAYRELDGQPIQSSSIQQSKREIEGALGSLNTAFEKLLDSLFRDMAIDVSSDISVLHTVLAQEGLVDGPFDSAKRS